MGSAVLKLNRWENAEYLRKQLDKNLYSSYRVWGKWIEDYLLTEGIYDLNDVTEQDILNYKDYIDGLDNMPASKKKAYKRYLETFVWGNVLEVSPELYERVMTDSRMESDVRTKVGAYLLLCGITDTGMIDFELRERFAGFLVRTGITTRQRNLYLKGLDKLKYESIRRQNALRPFETSKLTYDGKTLYLGYHPDYETAMSLYLFYEKDWKVYDLPNAPKQLRNQILALLNWIFQEKKNLYFKYNHRLLPLNLLYRYCMDHSIGDLETLEEEDYVGYRESLKHMCKSSEARCYEIVDIVQKFLFCNNARPRWEANAWYLDRFSFKDDRMNPARPVGCLNFWQVHDPDNRDLFKEYIKYEIGLTNEAIDTIRNRQLDIRAFLGYCDEKGYSVRNMNRNMIEGYSGVLKSRELEPKTHNKSLSSVFMFWEYLYVKGKTVRPDLTRSEIMMRTYEKHNDLTMSHDLQMRVLKAVKAAPEHLRLIVLNIWATGSRANEICTVTADSYILDAGRTYIQVRQYKLKKDKLIPIPLLLYQVMTDYIRKLGKKGKEFVFNRKDGVGSYLAHTFYIQMNRLLKAVGVSDKEYSFRPHAYRHCMGTRLFDADVVIQVIRDFLGHDSEEMTKQYIDFMGDRIRKDSHNFFESVRGKIDYE